LIWKHSGMVNTKFKYEARCASHLYYPSCAPYLVTLTFSEECKLPHAILQNFFRLLLLPLSQVQSSQTPSLNVIPLELETNITCISFFPIQVTSPQMWFNYTNNVKYIQLLEYSLFPVIKNINKIDHSSLPNTSIRQNLFQNSLKWPHTTMYTITFKKL
jgi:hypothetical protein